MTAKTTLNIHPKVFVGLLAGIGAAILGGLLTYVSPETFAGLGHYELPVFELFSVGLGSAAAWLKREEAADEVDSPAATAVSATIDPAVESAAETAAPSAFDALLAPLATAALAPAPSAPSPAPAAATTPTAAGPVAYGLPLS